MRRLSWLGCFSLMVVATGVHGYTGIFVQGAANGTAPDAAYQTDAAMLRGNPDPAASIGLPDLGNWGASSTIGAGRDYGLLRRSVLCFPLSSLAGKAGRITGARLILSVVYPPHLGLGVSSLERPIQFELYQIADANAGWTEGDSSKGDTVPGAVCWAGRHDSTTPWKGSKGCGTPGIDFIAEPVSTATLAGPTWSNGRRLVFELKNPVFLQNWIAQPAKNAGFLLRSSTLEALPAEVQMYSIDFFSDDEDPSAKDPRMRSPILRPRLEVEYDAPSSEPLAVAPFPAGAVGGDPNAACDVQATSLFGGGGDGSYGAAPDLRVGVEPVNLASRPWRSLLKFDLSAMRAYSRAVRSARLTLTIRSAESTDDALAAFHVFELYRISKANAGWQEGLRADGGPEAGVATWDWLAQGVSSWAGGHPAGGGLDVSGLDYDASPLSSRLLVPAELQEGAAVTFDMSNSGFLSGWIDLPASNGGFRLSAPTLEDAGRAAPATLGRVSFYSDDTTQSAKRPRLDLFYSTAAKSSRADPAWLGTR